MKNAKEDFILKFNEAFQKEDIDFITECFTEDMEWEMVGDTTIKGRDNIPVFFEAMSDGDKMESYTIQTLITHGKNASANGILKMKSANGTISSYGFCDVYHFSGFKNPKISRLTSYVVPLKD